MLGEVFEELHPSLGRVVRIDGPGNFTGRSQIAGKFADDVLENLLQ